MRPNTHPLRLTLACLVTLSVAGCGGSDSETGDDDTTATVTGSAVAGAVNGTLTVTNASGTQLATASFTNGDFTVELPASALAGELDFEVIGTYTDEVSTDTVNLTATAPLALRLTGGALSGDGTVGITPETTVIRQMVTEQAMTLTEARTAYAAAFGEAPDGLARPFDPTTAGPSWADAGAEDAAFRVGAYSQWGSDLGLSGDELAQFPTALAADLEDGELDGHDGTNPVSVGAKDLSALHAASPLTARYLGAMATFAGSASNVAGVSAPSTLPPLANTVDTLPAERIVTLTDGTTQYKVKLEVNNSAPFPSMAATAHTVHQVTVTSGDGAIPVDLNTATITPSVKMHMLSGMGHSTPFFDTCAATSDLTNGICDIDVYYVMASGMGDTPMGLWDFEVTFPDNTSALFHPKVGMPMDGSVFSAKGVDLGNTDVPYWAWLDTVEANAGGGHDITLLLSTKSGMMFPKVTDATVEIALADADGNWGTFVPLTGDGAGRYSKTGFSGLATDAANTLGVKIVLNGGSNVRTSSTNPAYLSLVFTAP